MVFLIIGLILLAIASNVTMDEIDHRWSRWFGKVIKNEKLAKWLNPRLSWHNKKSNNKIVQFILSTLLIFITDFWHLLKFIFINSIFTIIILLFKLPWEVIIIMNLGWGAVFEFVNGIYGLLSDNIKSE